jgi:hypothetical protein
MVYRAPNGQSGCYASYPPRPTFPEDAQSELTTFVRSPPETAGRGPGDNGELTKAPNFPTRSWPSWAQRADSSRFYVATCGLRNTAATPRPPLLEIVQTIFQSERQAKLTDRASRGDKLSGEPSDAHRQDSQDAQLFRATLARLDATFAAGRPAELFLSMMAILGAERRPPIPPGIVFVLSRRAPARRAPGFEDTRRLAWHASADDRLAKRLSPNRSHKNLNHRTCATLIIGAGRRAVRGAIVPEP